MNEYVTTPTARASEPGPTIDLTGLATRDVAITEVTLTTANGYALFGEGDAKRHPNDLPDVAFGADLATLRALRDLVTVLEAHVEYRARGLVERQAQLDEYRRAERNPAVMAPLFVGKVEPFDRRGLKRLLARVNESARHAAARVAADREYAGIREYVAGLKAAGVPREERLAAADHYRRYFADESSTAVSVGFRRTAAGTLIVDSIAEVAVQGDRFAPVDMTAEEHHRFLDRLLTVNASEEE